MNPSPRLSPLSYPWYAVQCQPKKEYYVANILKKEPEVSVFLPEYSRWLRGKLLHAPFFPGYLFAQMDLEKMSPSRINTLPGVVRLVAFGGDPVPVPYSVIETIFDEVNRLNARDHLPHDTFRPGDRVKVKDGPLQYLEMVLVGPMTPSNRTRVLLHFLGRLKEIQIDVDRLERMTNASKSELNSLMHMTLSSWEGRNELHSEHR